MTLFDDCEPETVERPTHAAAEQVRALEGFGYRKEAVRRWTREKAESVLRQCRREERLALRRADAKAKTIDSAESRPGATQVERETAARFVEQAMGDGADELVQAVMYTVHVLNDDETRRLAGHLVRLYRGQS